MEIAATTYSYATDWMQKEISVPFLVFFAGGTNETHRHQNIGLESMGYLTFIAQYYNCLPKVGGRTLAPTFDPSIILSSWLKVSERLSL